MPVILVIARDAKVAKEIQKAACIDKARYIYRRDQLQGYRDAVILHDGTGECSIWNTLDPVELMYKENRDEFQRICIPLR